MDFGKATRLVRAARGISQSELAVKVQCSPSTISLIESGQRQPSLEMGRRIAEAMDVPFNLFVVLSADRKEDCDMEPEDAEQIGRRLLSILTGHGGDGK